ncbi:MAG TPA: galactose-1-phosphate uridylyltransferase [Candidatus Bathyarchaeia archaeon]|nr:galactose-1-phosphate uridylyltransferase [Candidatus Bathyarchaeia archaeon]
MPYNELRKDYLLDRWVVIATERGRRPTDFAKQKKEPAQASVCPLCPGNEHMTPPAVLVYLKSNGEIRKDKDTNGLRHKNWLIRCVPNLFPAFAPPKEPKDQQHIIKSDSFGCAIGHHEVLVESPCHDEDPADAELPQLLHVINACVDRLRELSAKPYVRYVSIFRNHGLEAGASLSHAHSQIIATPFVPTIVDKEIAASRNFWNQHGKCVFCDVIERESKSPRLVLDNARFVVLAPYASVHPMEFWILPKKHDANLLNLTQTEMKAFAETLKASLKALKDLVNDPPYNYGFHLSINREAENCYHWHLEVYPKLAIWAGFEKNTGTYINTVTPETAAAELRKAITA